MTTNPYASLCRKCPPYVTSWAPSHQTNSNMQKCPSGTTYKYHFPNTPGKCRSLPYGTPRAGSASMLKKELANEIPEAKWEIQNIHNHPYQTALGSRQHSGLDKFNYLPNDHPQASEGPDKTIALISTDQPHNCNVDGAPQNSSSQNLARKVKDWRDWTYTDGSLQKNEVGQDTGSGVHHPHFNVSHYVNLWV